MADQLMDIALNDLVPNPANRPIRESEVLEMMGSLKEAGQRQPVKVAPLGQGKYRILGGHIRHAAAKRLGWKSLKALVRKVEPTGFNLEAALDNRHAGLFWLDMYQDIVKVAADRPGLSIRELGLLMGINQTYVAHALKTMRVLKPGLVKAISAARAGGEYVMPENCVIRLLTLVEGKSDEGRDRLEEALARVLELRLNLSQVLRLSRWMREGNKASDFDPSGPSPAIQAPKAPGKLPLGLSWRRFLTPERLLKMGWSLLTLLFLFAALKWSQKSSIQVHVKDIAQPPDVQFNPGKDFRE